MVHVRRECNDLSWQFEPDRAIYTQIVEHITTDILRGVYPKGERLPSVRELAVEASVNPNTMQKALSELENLGLAVSQRNSGRFVTTDEVVLIHAKNGLAQSYAAEYIRRMESLGYDPGGAAQFILDNGKGVVENGSNT